MDAPLKYMSDDGRDFTYLIYCSIPYSRNNAYYQAGAQLIFIEKTKLIIMLII